MALPNVREVIVGSHVLNVVNFTDLRDASNEMEFLFQSQVQMILFANEPIGTTGALYRLLTRAGVGARSLPLRRTSVAAGLITDQEFDFLRELLHTGVRVFTLIPLGILRAAIACFGRTPQSELLLSALGLPTPDEWASGSTSSDEGRKGGTHAGPSDQGDDSVGGGVSEDSEGSEEDEGEEEIGRRCGELERIPTRPKGCEVHIHTRHVCAEQL
jgi:hypothetical protein